MMYLMYSGFTGRRRSGQWLRFAIYAFACQPTYTGI